ncbi:hypothetical protein [Bartonella apis]|uniref:hypothetical protein n=1 Tax=Bartonella apis TaxID=1686310 RepID=UPI0009666A81|nr:hypothetical protein [Bartonella apis]OLY47203.1 hypothetical protein PEB0122_020410 [Bartonella apis]
MTLESRLKCTARIVVPASFFALWGVLSVFNANAEDKKPELNFAAPQQTDQDNKPKQGSEPKGANTSTTVHSPATNKTPNILTDPVKAQQPVNTQQKAELTLNARLTDKGSDISRGLIWRIYEPIYGVDNKLPLVTSAEGGSAHFSLDPGSYIVHVSFGHASVMRRITVRAEQKLSETLVLDAGGLKLNATMPEGKINPQYLRFSIYSDDSENDDTALILSDVKAGEVIRLKTGTYHIVSNYGSANAISRSDIRVDAGKITEATMQHHAALITLKLVRQQGGEALADTSWSITNDSGDIIRETVGAYATLVLAEGDYIAIAKNKDQIYQKEFSVTSGRDEDVDVVTTAQPAPPVDDSMD